MIYIYRWWTLPCRNLPSTVDIMYIHWFWLIMIMDYSLMDYNLMIYMYYTIWFTTYYINIVSYDYVLCHDIMYIHWLWYYMIWWLWIIDDYSLMDYNLMIMYCVMILCRLHTFRLYNTLYIYIYIYIHGIRMIVSLCVKIEPCSVWEDRARMINELADPRGLGRMPQEKSTSCGGEFW